MVRISQAGVSVRHLSSAHPNGTRITAQDVHGSAIDLAPLRETCRGLECTNALRLEDGSPLRIPHTAAIATDVEGVITLPVTDRNGPLGRIFMPLRDRLVSKCTGVPLSDAPAKIAELQAAHNTTALQFALLNEPGVKLPTSEFIAGAWEPGLKAELVLPHVERDQELGDVLRSHAGPILAHSNSAGGFLELAFGHLGFSVPGHFVGIVALEELDIYSKPQGRAYEIAAERLGVPIREMWVLDDRLGNLRGAREAGVERTVLIGPEPPTSNVLGHVYGWARNIKEALSPMHRQ